MVAVAAESAQQIGGIETLVQLIVATAGSGVLVAVIQGFFTRRKTRAEVESTGASATKLITDAAAGIVDRLQNDNAGLRSEVIGMRAELATCKRDCAELRDWKDAAEDVLAQHGLHVAPTPPSGVQRAT